MRKTHITKHFKIAGFACPCCAKVIPNLALSIILEDIRLAFGSHVIINSGTRCKKHNKAVGGAPQSQHLLGTAVDIVVSGIPATDIYHYLLTRPYADSLGLGRYNTFTHIDVRGNKARWRL